MHFLRCPLIPICISTNSLNFLDNKIKRIYVDRDRCVSHKNNSGNIKPRYTVIYIGLL